MMRLRTALLGVALMLAPVAAKAQSTYPSVGGATVPTSVAMCLNSSGQAVPLFNAAGTWQCSGATIPVTATFSGTGANNADAVASVATGLVSDASYLFGYNGATWDRLRADTTSGLWVQVKAALPAGTALIGKFGIDQTTPGTTNGVALNVTPTVAAGNGVIAAPSSETLAGITPIVSAALESNHVIKASAGNFYSGYITTGATAGWLLLANSTTAPTAGGAAIAPLACVLAPANQTTSIGGAGLVPLIFSTGITMVFSTSGCLTNTASTTAFFSGMAK